MLKQIVASSNSALLGKFTDSMKYYVSIFILIPIFADLYGVIQVEDRI
jgi:hypothetical protein